MKISWIFLGIFGIAVSTGFSLDRSDPVGWDNGPMIETSNGKLELTGMEKVLQTSKAKKSIKPDEEMTDCAHSKKRSDLMTSENPKINGFGEFKDDIILSLEENSSEDTENEIPKNVILLFVNESTKDPWTSLTTLNNFPVHSFLHSCRNDGNLLRVRLAEYFSSKPIDQCECENLLRSNIDFLLAWAHRVKKMATGIIEDTNAPIPLAIGYESPIFRQNFENTEEIKIKDFIHQLHDDGKLLDLAKEGSTSFPSTMSTAVQEIDGMWDVMDTFSKMRSALFRSWLYGFQKTAAELGEFSTLKPIESTLVELMGDTVDKLKSLANDNGFVLIAVAPEKKISDAVEILDKKINVKDTLLVVAEACSQGRHFIQFFARGPGSNYFYGAKTLWDLPLVAKKALFGCQELWCKFGLLNPALDTDHDFQSRISRERFIRNAVENTTAAAVNITETAKILKEKKVNVGKETENNIQQIDRNKSTDVPVQNLTQQPELKSSQSPSTKISEIPTVKDVEKEIQNSTVKVNETSTQKAVTEVIVTQTSEAENTTEIEDIDQRILAAGGASGFSMKMTPAVIGVIISIFINL